MELDLYQVDAFSDKVFAGNPAAVCPLDDWLSDDVLQSIAAENNLSETAYFVKTNDRFRVRWFTPTREVKLCGHATLASAFVLFEILGYARDTVVFDSLSGVLTVHRRKGWYELDFPSQPPQPCVVPDHIVAALRQMPVACFKAEDYIVILDSDDAVRKANPDLNELKQLDLRGVCITAQGGDYDFVHRFFAPKYGIDEDPVTGSAVTQLAPLWGARLDKVELKAKQVSRRGGLMSCRLAGDRVVISGQAALYMKGSIYLV